MAPDANTYYAPDGGWGWIVVLGSFLIHVIADGVAYSFGIFYVEFLDYFKESRGVTGWIGSLMVGITWGSGPLASVLTHKFGCRAVTIMGSFMSAVGFIISIWAPNVWFLYFSLGIIAGVGLGLIYLPAIVSVTFYFEKRRSFATGLAVCGSGIGTFIFAPLTTYLVEEYTWRGALLILAGLLLNCILCGALFRPLKAHTRSSNEADGNLSSCEQLKEGAIVEHSDGKMSLDVQCSSCDTRTQTETHTPCNSLTVPNSNLNVASQSIASLHKLYPEDLEGTTSNNICKSLLETMDLSLLKNPYFLLFAISNFLTSIGFCIPYMFLPDLAEMKRINAQRAAFLISIIGIANTIGRVVFGFLSDRKFVNRLYLYNIALTICGISTSMTAFCHTFHLLCLYAAVFGLFLGVYVSLTSVVLVDLLGLESLTSSFGITLLFQGVAGIIGPPIAGSLYDVTGSYDIPFYVMGALIAISGLMLFSIPCIQRREKKHQKDEKKATHSTYQ